MEFSRLIETFGEVEQTSSRNLITEYLVTLLRDTPANEIREVCYLLLGQLGPMFHRIDFGVADRMAERALSQAFNTSVEDVHQLFKHVGDLGLTTEQLAQKNLQTGEHSRQNLSVDQMYKKLIAIAEASGTGSQEIKINLLSDLLRSSLPEETKYVMRMVLGRMRLGFSDKTILDVLSVVSNGSKTGRDELDYAYQVFPDIGWIAEQVKLVGIKKISQTVNPEMGVPVMPALAQRLKTADEMVKKMGTVMVEPKYDGTRTEIHYSAHGKWQMVKDLKSDYLSSDTSHPLLVKTFARSLEETTAQFPETEKIADQLEAESVIIDSEAIGYDPVTGGLRPFQETITRKRKHGIEAASEQIPIKFFCFDLLYLNGESLIHRPLSERRKLLEKILKPGPVLVLDPMIVTDKADEVRAFHAQQLSGGLEGAMVKKYDGEYQPGRTGWNWVKFKEEETAEGKLKDTVDTVVMGYYRGKGKRSNFGIGAFLVGVLDKENNVVTVAKIGTGLTDDQWRELKNRADGHFTMTKPEIYTVADSLAPDVWVEPSIVVEIAADELTKSPLHTAGYGLRFPRLVKFRDDKRADQATTVDEVKIIGNITDSN